MAVNGGNGGNSPNGGNGGIGSTTSGQGGSLPGGGGAGAGAGPGSSGGIGGDGANGGVKFSWTEELLEDFEGIIPAPPDSMPPGWFNSGGIWGADNTRKTFGTQSLRGTVLEPIDTCSYYIPDNIVEGYSSLKIDVRTDSSSSITFRLEDYDNFNQQIKTVNTDWETFEVSLNGLLPSNDAQLHIIVDAGVSVNIDNLRGVL